MTCNVFSGIKDTLFGAIALDQVQTCNYQEDATIEGARGDDMIHKCALGLNLVDTTGEINTRNMALSETIKIGTQDDLSFEYTLRSGTGNPGLIDIIDVMIGSVARAGNHGSPSELTFPWEASSVDGSTSPITEDYTP